MPDLSRIVFVIAVAGSLSLACKPTSTEAFAPLRIAWSYYPGYSPFVVAFQKKIFKARRLNIEPILYDVSAKQLPDFEAGRLDGGFFAFADALTLDARTPDSARLVLVADNSHGADLVVAAPDIQRVQDLAGKRIGTGIGSFRELLVRQMLAAHGMTPDSVSLVNMGPEKVPDALPNVIQAGQTWDPFAAKALAKGAKVIFTSTQTPGLIPDVLIFRKSVVKDRPDDVRTIVDGWFEALQFWNRHPQEGNRLIAEATQRSPDAISTDGIRLFSRDDNRKAFHDTSDPRSLHVSGQINADFMISTGVLGNAPDLNRLLEPRFLGPPE